MGIDMMQEGDSVKKILLTDLTLSKNPNLILKPNQNFWYKRFETFENDILQVVKAVGGQVPVFVDGGIRRGTDVFKALALGASGVFVSAHQNIPLNSSI
jgi:uncharacterized protein related to proFAR isomerase